MKILGKIITLVFITILAISPVKLAARSVNEIQIEIDTNTKLKQQSQHDLNKTQLDLQNSQLALTNSQQGLPQAQIEIANIETQIKFNKLQKDIFNNDRNIKQLQKQQTEEKQLESLKESYIQWKSQDHNSFSMFFNSDYDFKKASRFSEMIIGNQQTKLLAADSNLITIQNNISEFDKKIGDLSQQNTDLQNKLKQLQDQSNYYNSQITAGNTKISGLQNSIQTIQTNLSALTQEQKQASQQENQILSINPGKNNNGTTHEPPQDQVPPSNPTTTFYFYGQGRELYQGHGVGLSQYGIRGMASAGYKYQDITKFYYTGTVISSGYENRSINVDGYGNKNIEDYTAGQSEIPSKACGTQDQVNQNPQKYTIYNGNTWSCWPEEAIKAQVVAYRTYAIYQGSVCTTAACQHYDGSQRTRWAVDETKGQVITYNSQPIDAIYASDNSEGFGTANNDTVFQTFAGNGTPYPYLKAVDDNQYDSNPDHWNNWAYKTKSYTMNDLNTMLNEESSDSSINGIKYYLSNIKTSLGGSISSISFERDSSKRVKKVWFKGVNGNSISLGGYWFKYVWIIWQSKHGQDYIYSQTFFLHEV